MKLTLLGTGSPIPDTSRRGPSQVIEIGGDLVLVDCGAGTLHRLLEAGYDRPRISHIALTHLHSDHITGLPDLLWAGWISAWWDPRPVIAGPPGTARFIERLIDAFEYDINVRTGNERGRASLIPPVVEVEEGWSAEGDGWRISGFRVDHMPVDQAFGYRLEDGRASAVISGDTCYSENLVAHAQGVDLLVHEAYWARGMRERLAAAASTPLEARLRVIARYHTPSDAVGKVAAAAGARHLVLSHLIGGNAAAFTADAEADFRGRLTVGQDLLSFETA